MGSEESSQENIVTRGKCCELCTKQASFFMQFCVKVLMSDRYQGANQEVIVENQQMYPLMIQWNPT